MSIGGYSYNFHFRTAKKMLQMFISKQDIGDFPGGPGSIPGQGTRSHTHAATKKSAGHNEDPACLNEDPAQPK